MKIHKVDRIILYYPFLIIALIAFYFLNNIYAGAEQSWGRSEIRISSILAFVIFGNFAHNFMSFWQIFRIQEFKSWSKEYSFYGLSIWQIIAIVYIFFLSLVLFVLPNGFNTFSIVFGDNLIVNLIVFFFFTINTHHNLAQMKGIGFSHTFHYLQNTSKEIKESLHKKEHYFYQFLMVDWFFYIGWLKFSNREHFEIVTILRGVIFCIAFGLMIRTYLKLPKDQAQLKIIYSARHLYRLFFSLHPIFVFIAYGMHGADAILTYWKTIDKTQSKKQLHLKFEFVIIVLMLSALYIHQYVINKPSEYAAIQNIMISLFLTHYIVEGFLYRFRNPVTNKHILKLL